MSADHHARRETPLAGVLKERIRREGPVSVRDYMTACLQDETHGYYRSQPAIGQGGDFVTAPEISQVFGELIGLWAAVVWQGMGEPAEFDFIELGPGRGTLMADALRAARIVPGFLPAARVSLVESNDTLRAAQRKTLDGPSETVRWLAEIGDVDLTSGVGALRPAIVIANEFLDAMPGRQWIKTGTDAWAERGVGLDPSGRLTFMTMPGTTVSPPAIARSLPATEVGAIVEQQDFSRLHDALAHRATCRPVAALFVDYGHARSAAGETLQAVRGHRHEHVLTSPGEADLSMQVDFAQFVRGMGPSDDAVDGGLVVDGPTTQAEFLGALGIAQRASRLMAANPVRAASIEQDVARLMAPEGMGTRFKVVGLRSAGLPALPALPVIDRARDTP